MHEDNFCLFNDFGVVHESEDNSHGADSVRSSNDREWTESFMHIEFMHSNRPWKGIHWHVDNVCGSLGLRKVLVSAVRLLEDTVDICDFLYQ